MYCSYGAEELNKIQAAFFSEEPSGQTLIGRSYLFPPHVTSLLYLVAVHK